MAPFSSDVWHLMPYSIWQIGPYFKETLHGRAPPLVILIFEFGLHREREIEASVLFGEVEAVHDGGVEEVVRMGAFHGFSRLALFEDFQDAVLNVREVVVRERGFLRQV